MNTISTTNMGIAKFTVDVFAVNNEDFVISY